MTRKLTARTFDLTPFLGRDEGQRFDRKSMFEGEEGKKRPRDRRKVRDQMADQVAGFANTEGGVLLRGLRDRELPPDLAAAVKALGPRPRQGPLRDVVGSACTWRPLKPAALGSILGIRADNLSKRQLTQMVAEGPRRRCSPAEPPHPNQANAAASDNAEKSPT